MAFCAEMESVLRAATTAANTADAACKRALSWTDWGFVVCGHRHTAAQTHIHALNEWRICARENVLCDVHIHFSRTSNRARAYIAHIVHNIYTHTHKHAPSHFGALLGYSITGSSGFLARARAGVIISPERGDIFIFRNGQHYNVAHIYVSLVLTRTKKTHIRAYPIRITHTSAIRLLLGALHLRIQQRAAETPAGIECATLLNMRFARACARKVHSPERATLIQPNITVSSVHTLSHHKTPPICKRCPLAVCVQTPVHKRVAAPTTCTIVPQRKAIKYGVYTCMH